MGQYFTNLELLHPPYASITSFFLSNLVLRLPFEPLLCYHFHLFCTHFSSLPLFFPFLSLEMGQENEKISEGKRGNWI